MRLAVVQPAYPPVLQRRSRRHSPHGRAYHDDGARRTSDGHGFARSGRQASAALESTGTKNVPAGSSGHAMTKAVLLGSAAIVGLERALHFGPPRPSGLPAAFGSMLIDRCNGSMLATPSMPGTVRPATVGATYPRRQHRVRATVADPPAKPPLSSVDRTRASALLDGSTSWSLRSSTGTRRGRFGGRRITRADSPAVN